MQIHFMIRRLSDITITGTAGKTKAISDGFILASGRDSDDETVEFKFLSLIHI